MPGLEDRERIVRAADALFYGRGIQAVGMDAVRTAAGVSLKRLYTVFSSKEQIVLAVLDYRHEVWVDGIERAAVGSTTPREKLLAMYDYLARWFATDSFRGCGFINAFGELGAVSPHVAEIARAHKQQFQNYVADIVHELGGTVELAAQLAILAEGAQTTAAISGSSLPATHARHAAEFLIDATPVAAVAGLDEDELIV